MGQTRLASLVEVVVGTLLAFTVSVTTQVIMFPWFGINVSVSQNVAIVLIFTCISMVRSYLVRRLFNWIGNRRST